MGELENFTIYLYVLVTADRKEQEAQLNHKANPSVCQ